ncbi:uncharacterized protein LOC135462754 [Liolophura sinensis]|uniref:uncharacterized protein LOC135462754 n=1 Tax=Liolophura sinensis TaxID=3198878 RepID=UPI003158BBD6
MRTDENTTTYTLIRFAMAALRADRLLLYQVFIFYCVAPGLEAVRILVEHQTVTANPSVALVTLPCEYNSTSVNSPSIDWYLLANQQRQGVMSVGTRNNITVHESYRGRVARGDQASLVLIGPSVRDSGTYLCQVKISGETPNWANGLVSLKVINQSEVNVSTAVAMNCSRSSSAALWVLLVIDWIIPMCCVHGFSESYRGLHARISLFSNIMIALLGVIVVISTILITVSMKYLTDCYSKDSLRWAVGIPTGISGDLLLIGVILLLVRLRKTHTPPPVKGEKTDEKCPLEVSLEDLTLDNLICAQTLVDAPDVIHCMVPTGNKNNFYISTDHSVYLYDQSGDEFKEIRLAHAHNIFMISLDKGKLLVSTYPVDVTRRSFILKRTASSSIKRNAVLLVDLKTSAESSSKLSFSTIAPWICVNLKGDWCVTDAQKGLLHILKKGAKSETKKTIGAGFLESPCCVVQNSSGCYIIADSQKHDVYIFQKNGCFLTSLKVKNSDRLPDKMSSPFQLALDRKDKLYVAAKDNDTVYVFSASFEFLGKVPFGPTDGTTHLTSLMVNPLDDTLYVAFGTTIKTLSVDSIDLTDSNMNEQSTC